MTHPTNFPPCPDDDCGGFLVPFSGHYGVFAAWQCTACDFSMVRD